MLVVSNSRLGKRLAKGLGASYEPLTFSRFPDGELKITLPLKKAPTDIVLLFSLRPELSINDLVASLLLTLTELRRQLPKSKITLILPYLPYARQDKEKLGEINVCRALLTLLKQLADQLIVIDPHADWQKMNDWFAPKKLIVLSINRLFLDYLKKARLADYFLAAPDHQSAERYANTAKELNKSWVVFAKTRLSGKKVEQTLVSPLPPAKTAVFIDDIISTGGTLLEAQKILKQKGVKKFIALVTHFVGGAQNLKNLRQAGWQIIATNSLERPDLKGLKRLDVLPLISSSKLC